MSEIIVAQLERLRATSLPDMVPGLKKSGAYHIGPCPFCGGRDRFNIKATAEGQYLWLCRGCGDGKYHDAVDFLQRSTGKSFAELVNGGAVASLPISNTPALIDQGSTPGPLPPNDDWQAAATDAQIDAWHYLQGDTKTAATVRDYLTNSRKLSAWSIENSGIGFNPTRREVMPGHWLEPGITIPCWAPGPRRDDGGHAHLWYLNVRTTKAARATAAAEGRRVDKYHCLKGSKLKALYGAGLMLQARRAVFVAEGELDAIVMRQYCPPGVTAVTMGSASTVADSPTWARYFAVPARILLLLDNDDAGAKSLAKWQELFPRAEAVTLPDGFKDPTDYRREGPLWSWVAEMLKGGD